MQKFDEEKKVNSSLEEKKNSSSYEGNGVPMDEQISFLSKKGKMILGIIVFIYINAMMIFMFIRNIDNDRKYIDLLILAVADISMLCLVFSTFLGKHQKSIKVNSVASLLAELDCANKDDVIYLENEELEAIDDDADFLQDLEPVISKRDRLNFNDEISLDSLVEDFSMFAAKRGLVVDKYSIRELIASMASEHLIFIKSFNAILAKQIVSLLCEYFEVDVYTDQIDDSYTNTSSLIYNKKTHSQTSFLSALLAAKAQRNSVNFAILENVNPNTMMNYFKNVLPFTANPSEDYKIRVNSSSGERVFDVPLNIWFLAIVDENFKEDISPDVAAASISITISCHEDEGKVDAKAEHKVISYKYFNHLVAKARDEYYLDEILWKKLDEFESYLNELVDLNLSNKKQCQIEDYLSVYLGCSGMENDALDSLLMNKILPMSYKELANNPEFKFLDMSEKVDRIFGTDIVPLVQKGIATRIKG